MPHTPYPFTVPYVTAAPRRIPYLSVPYRTLLHCTVSCQTIKHMPTHACTQNPTTNIHMCTWLHHMTFTYIHIMVQHTSHEPTQCHLIIQDTEYHAYARLYHSERLTCSGTRLPIPHRITIRYARTHAGQWSGQRRARPGLGGGRAGLGKPGALRG